MKTKQKHQLEVALLLVSAGVAVAQTDDEGYINSFNRAGCTFSTTGNTSHWPIRVGDERYFYNAEDDEELLITITPLTRVIDGVRCRVIREAEWEGGKLVEFSWNYAAVCNETGDVFYFGEHVNIWEEDGSIVNEGAWIAGEGDNIAGIIMTGNAQVGDRYYQEIAPGVALDRAQHVSIGESMQYPAGTFGNLLYIEETSPLSPGEISEKYYAPGVGMVHDDGLDLVAMDGDVVYRPEWGWRFALSSFGSFGVHQESGWVYSEEFDWVYPIDDGSGGAYLFSDEDQTWLWTHPEIGYWVYSFADGQWEDVLN